MRTLVARAGSVALAEPLPSDLDELRAGEDGAFDVDPDDRPGLREVVPERLSVVDADTGALLGQVSWHATGWGRTRACGAWNLGIVLLPAARGRRAGVSATRLVAEHLFATTDLDRVEAATDVDNEPALRALSGAGFTREGVVRGAQLRGGIRRDMVLFGLLRDDHRAVPPDGVTDGHGHSPGGRLISGT